MQCAILNISFVSDAKTCISMAEVLQYYGLYLEEYILLCMVSLGE